MRCECGKDALFDECCGRFLNGTKAPQTCEELVRSRFVAFGLGKMDYIERTQVHPLSPEVRERQVPEWEKLAILSCQGGGPEDHSGEVRFVATYRRDDGLREHRERASFVRVNGQWLYSDGEIEDTQADETVRPNQPCPCGSGRKYNRCCGVPKGA